MSRGLTGIVLKGYGARDFTLTLLSKREIAPHFTRLRFASATLFQEIEWHPATWLRFWFPDPAGKRRELQRAYTLVAAYPEQGQFEIDVLMHEPPGPATLWFMQAKPGDTIPSTFLGSRFRMPQPVPAGFLLVGDASSTPAINNIIAAVPAEAVLELYLESTSEHDVTIPLEAHPQLHVQRVPRSSARSLIEAIRRRERAGWYAWGAGEAGTMKLLHKALKEEHGFTKEAMHVQSYWAETPHTKGTR